MKKEGALPCFISINRRYRQTPLHHRNKLTDNAPFSVRDPTHFSVYSKTGDFSKGEILNHAMLLYIFSIQKYENLFI